MKTLKKILLFSMIPLILVGCGENNNGTDIINPDAEFLYFFGATCPHCQELNAKVKEEDLFSQISVEKREVYFNEGNREKFVATANDLGLKESETGVPFVYDKISGEHAIGVEPALALFKSRLNGAVEMSDDEGNTDDTSETEENQETEDIEPEEVSGSGTTVTTE